MTEDRCPLCGSKTRGEWKFCAVCGGRLPRRAALFPFGLENLFKSFSREFERMEKDMKQSEKDFGVIDLREMEPMFRGRRPGARGFTISISTKTGERPKIDVKTFGDIERRQLEEQLARQLGVNQKEIKSAEIRVAPNAPAFKPALRVAPTGQAPRAQPTEAVRAAPVQAQAASPKVDAPGAPATPTVTEEPKAKITQMPGKVLVELELPGVKNEGDIEVSEMPESVEVKAKAKDKVYFKIITLPPELKIAASVFKNERLRLEFGYGH